MKHSKWRLAAATVAILPVLMAAECKLPGKKEDPPNHGSCNVLGRDVNSKGQPHMELDCDLDGTRDSAPPIPAPDSYPKCNVNTYWPACQDA
jgi:hypothetical protein